MNNKVIFFIVSCFFPINCVFAQLSASEIIKKVDEVRNPQMDYITSVEVVSYSLGHEPKSATYDVMVKGKDRTIIKTVLPKVERGRILLMRDRNLWAFFPEVSKPLRLSMQERLIGEVSNGDIARTNFTGDYNAKLLRIEKLGAKEYYVLELIARSAEVTYGKVTLWVEKETYRPFKAEFFAISGRLIKLCFYESYKMRANRIRPTELVMDDPFIKGRKSVIKYDNMKIEEIPEKYFSKEYMKKLMQ